ncbi:DUF6294 family protein [Edaphobacter aggregans]|uniref:DUF6294 family protein n=1 Tax=Edaphobacter aggregans TaxID=570835 RepID=UPI003917BCEE
MERGHTNKTMSGDVWHATVHFYDSNGVELGHTGTHNSPTMGAGDGINPPRVSWSFTDQIDKSYLALIAKALENATC